MCRTMRVYEDWQSGNLLSEVVCYPLRTARTCCWDTHTHRAALPGRGEQLFPEQSSEWSWVNRVCRSAVARRDGGPGEPFCGGRAPSSAWAVGVQGAMGPGRQVWKGHRAGAGARRRAGLGRR